MHRVGRLALDCKHSLYSVRKHPSLHLMEAHTIENSIGFSGSEVPRKLRPSDWRPLMQTTRDAAARLVARGLLEVTQKGKVVEPSTAKGPIRLRLPLGEEEGETDK